MELVVIATRFALAWRGVATDLNTPGWSEMFAVTVWISDEGAAVTEASAGHTPELVLPDRNTKNARGSARLGVGSSPAVKPVVVPQDPETTCLLEKFAG